MASAMVLTEDEALELLAFLITAARTQLDEAAAYGPLRLLTAAGRLADFSAYETLARSGGVSPRRGVPPRDIISQTQTPAAPGAPATARRLSSSGSCSPPLSKSGAGSRALPKWVTQAFGSATSRT
jgi:hypothetical protein